MKTPRTASIGKQHHSNGAVTQQILGRSRSRIPKRWLWHYRTLLQLRERVLHDQQQQVRTIVEQLEPHSMSAADTASDEFDHNVALSDISAAQSALFEIDEALSRILNGTYGVCAEAKEVIPKARLRAIPWTRFSKQVETRLEKAGVIKTPSLGVLRSVRDGFREPSEEKWSDHKAV